MTRRAAACAVLALFAACSSGTSTSGSPSPRPTPDYGVAKWSAEPDGSNNCGDFAVGWESPDLGGRGPTATLHAINGEDVVLDLKGRDDAEQLTALWCGNVAGDGRMELATQRYTGGAHCCFTVRVDTLDGPTLLDADLGNYGEGRPMPAKLDDDSDYELVGDSDALAYFEDLSFAASPGFPLVFDFRMGRYVEATEDFPHHVREKLADAENDLRNVLEDGFQDAIRGMAAGVYAHHVLLGDEADALDEIADQLPADAADWLRDHADEAAKLVKGEATPAPT
jgi:hypothetical protein